MAAARFVRIASSKLARSLQPCTVTHKLPVNFSRHFSVSQNFRSETRPGLYYSPEHEWVKVDGENAHIGITAYAQDQLGDVVYCELPAVGDSFSIGDGCGTIESVKAVSDLFCPVSGEVIELNEAVVDTPGLLNKEPYDGGWLFKVKLTAKKELEDLLDEEKYKKLLEEGEDE